MAGSGVNTNANNKKSAEKLHQTIIRNFQIGKVYSEFKDNIWGSDIADIQLKLIKDSDFYCALLIFLVNMLGLFLRKTKKV